MKNRIFSFVAAAATLAFLATLCAASPTTDAPQQQIKIDQSLQIPGILLPPGTYTLTLEDRLRGRAILRIDHTNNTAQHDLLLTVPSVKLGKSTPTNTGLIFFPSPDSNNTNKQILRAWACPGCVLPLELVYSKDEAIKITADTGQSVLAADPTYDELPPNLSPDDMKVVTLWLLSPERISQNRGIGLKAAKYAPPATGMPAVPTRNRLPQTASDTYTWGAAGLALLLTFAALRLTRLRTRKAVPCES